MTIIGTYLSRYQGKISAEAVGRMIGEGVEFVGLRLTSGSGYIDPTWEHNAKMLRDTSILLFPWHFVTQDEANKQRSNFMNQVEKFNYWRLPPALDCEAFTQVGNYAFSAHELQAYPEIRRTLAAYELASSDPPYAFSPDGGQFGLWSVFGLSYPSEATVDAIGRWLTVWMAAQEALKKYVYPAIYTNVASGNVIFKTSAMQRYLLWVANWHSVGKPPLEKPNLPAVWKGKEWYIWQDAIIDGAPYGIDGQVSREKWGKLIPFPGDEPLPPPPEGNYIDLVGTSKDSSVWAGRLTEEA